MENNAKSHKFSILFDWFDQGRDGHLSREDFQTLAGLFLALPGGQEPENARALRSGFDTFWEALLAAGDASKDGRLSREEFISAIKSNVTAPGNFEQGVMAIIDAFMRIVDVNKDGSLTFKEYVQMYASLGIDPAHSSDAFKRLDRDNDGSLSYAEFQQAIKEFYLSDDEDAPGNWLLGPPAWSAKP